MKATLIAVGIILLVVGIIGLIYNYATVWMWVLGIIGAVVLVWGLMASKDKALM